MIILARLYILTVFFGCAIYAQDMADVKLRSSVDKALTTTGDVITFTLSLEYPQNLKLSIPEIGDKIQGFRIIDFGKEEKKEVDENFIDKRWYKLKTDMTGSYLLPAIGIEYTDLSGKKRKVTTSEIFIEVESLLNKDKDGEVGGTKDIRDIKEIRVTPIRLFFWGSIIFVMVGAIGGTIFFLSRKRSKEVGPEIILLPHEVALNEIKRLKAMDLDDVENYKIFHFEISEVLRSYFEGLYNFPATDRTNEEIKREIDNIQNLNKECRDTFMDVLAKTDIVKFTDWIPDKDLNQEVLEKLEQFVRATKPADEICLEEVESEDSVI